MNDTCGIQIRVGDLIAVTSAHQNANIYLGRVVSLKGDRVYYVSRHWSGDRCYISWMKKLKRILVLERSRDHVVDSLLRWDADGQKEPVHQVAGMTETEFMNWALSWQVQQAPMVFNG